MTNPAIRVVSPSRARPSLVILLWLGLPFRDGELVGAAAMNDATGKGDLE